MDLAPTRCRPFTLLLVSGTITRFGSIATSTTVLLHVAHLTELPFATGSVAAVQLLPLLALGLYGGHRLIALTGAGQPSFLRPHRCW